NHPELVDRLLFSRGGPTDESVRGELDEELQRLDSTDGKVDTDDFVGALRRGKGSAVTEVALADLAGDLSTRECTTALTAVAERTLRHAVRFALSEFGVDEGRGFVVIAMGKLGGREIGYGSDLDLFFVYEPRVAAASGGYGTAEAFARIAQRVIRLVSVP